MKIIIAAVAFSSEMSGVQRHAFNATRCLLARPEVSCVHLVVAPWQRGLVESYRQCFGVETDETKDIDVCLRFHFAAMDRSAFSRNLWYYRDLPKLSVELCADLVHLTYPVPIKASAYKCPTVVTLHDLYPYEIPANFSLGKVIFNRIILEQCLRNADAIACVSDTTRMNLGQYVPAQRHKAMRLYNCVDVGSSDIDDGLKIAVMPREHKDKGSPIVGWDASPFLLCVAQHRRNKNIPLLLRAFSSLLDHRRIDIDMKLLIVGIAGPETRRIQRAIADYKLTGKVVLLEGLSESQLRWCYARAEAVVAPSITEGFGLPVAEALLAGGRVVCSDIPAFREVGTEHARFVPLDEHAGDSLATAIAQTLSTPRKAPISLPQFSIRVLGSEYIALYRGLLASAPVVTGVMARTSTGASERLTG